MLILHHGDYHKNNGAEWDFTIEHLGVPILRGLVDEDLDSLRLEQHTQRLQRGLTSHVRCA